MTLLTVLPSLRTNNRKGLAATLTVKLSSSPEDDPQASVLLASIGSSEIRMLRGPEAHPDGVPLFWLELFDYRIQSSIDSFICHTLKDAVPVLEDFLSQAARQSKGLDDH